MKTLKEAIAYRDKQITSIIDSSEAELEIKKD